MGGGGGGDNLGLPQAKLRQLENAARELLKEKAPPAKRNVFISFATEDLGDVNLLRGQAQNPDSPIEFNDWSVKVPFNSKDAEYVKRGIRERIRQSSVTLVYISAQTASSQWVDWEIRESRAQGKQVIAVHQGDRPPTNLPSAIKEFGIVPVRWNWTELPRAIERAASS